MSIGEKLFLNLRAKLVCEESFTEIINGKEYDLCVICEGSTGILTSTPIDQRLYYEKGIGQLDKECYCQLALISKLPFISLI